jgi:hypothetical protein
MRVHFLASSIGKKLTMPRLIVHSYSISLDGYGAGPHRSLEAPLGIGGEALHERLNLKKR